MRKRWILIPVIAGLLALAVTGGAIFAQGNPDGPTGSGHQGIISRVAEILGLDEATVQDAFNQARQEQKDAALQNRLDQMVANEKLTQEEADAISQWYQTKPAVAVQLPVIMFRSEAALQRALDRLVAAEKISQDEANSMMTWYQDMPEAMSKVMPQSGFNRGFSRGFRGHRFRHGTKQDDAGNSDTGYFNGVPDSSSQQISAQSISY